MTADLQAEMELLRHDLQTRRNRTLLWRAFCLVVALGFLWGIVDSRGQTSEIKASRSEVLLASCVQDNIRILQSNALGAAVRSVVSLATSERERTPELVDFLNASNALLDETVVPKRDCSPAGLDAYYSTH